LKKAKQLMEDIKVTVEAAEADFFEFADKGKKVAVSRARKNLQELKKLAQSLRLHLQELKNKMKKK